MHYVIKSPREGWYLTEFHSSSGTTKYGKIKNAKIYCTKEEACEDLSAMADCGQRIVACTKIGKDRMNQESSSRRVERIVIPGRIKRREKGLSYR